MAEMSDDKATEMAKQIHNCERDVMALMMRYTPFVSSVAIGAVLIASLKVLHATKQGALADEMTFTAEKRGEQIYNRSFKVLKEVGLL